MVDARGAQQGAEQMMGQFQALTMGPAGGMGRNQEVGVDPNQFPRPTGPEIDKLIGAAPRDHLACDPAYMRMTSNAIPNSAELKKRWALPFGALIHPMAKPNEPVPVVNFGSAGVVRCRRCRTYINPYVGFIDGGKRWICNVCAQPNDVPVEYFCALDNNGRRRDHNERPELLKGTVEFVAPAEYMVRAPMPPTFIFVLDVSFAAVSSGMVAAAVETIRGCLDDLPGGERTQVGFVTFDATVHYYTIREGASGPSMLVVSDLEDIFLPTSEDLLVNVRECKEGILALLDTILKSFEGTQVVDSCGGSALQAAFLAAQQCGGKMLLFQATPTTKGPGKVKAGRDNASMYGTDREHQMRLNDDSFWRTFPSDCSKNQVAIDVFAFSGQYMDVASLACAANSTAGEVHYYPGFVAQRDAAKFQNELRHNLTRETGWEAVMRVRMGKGLRISTFNGHFTIRSQDLLSLPVIDPDKAFAIQIVHEDQLLASNTTYMQCALLYTSSSGERRIRVHTMAIPVVADVSEMYKAADGPACAALLAKLGVEKSYSSKLVDARSAVQLKTVNVIKEYRMMYSAHLHAHNKLIFPEALKLLPLFTLGMMKCPALRGGANDVMADERSAVGYEMLAMDVPTLLKILYPRVFPLHTLVSDAKVGLPVEGTGSVMLPAPIPASVEIMAHDGAYLIDNGRIMILWCGRSLAGPFVTEVLGLPENPSPQDFQAAAVEPGRDNDLSRRVLNIVNAQRGNRGVHQQCFVVRQGDAMEAHVSPYFVEDKHHGSMSHIEFLAHLHKAVMSNTSMGR